MQKALKKLFSYIKVFIEDGYHLYHIRQEPSMTYEYPKKQGGGPNPE